MNNKLKYTPGPWAWFIQDHSAATLQGPKGLNNHVMTVSPCESCREINKEFTWGSCETPSLNDAALIAAAPEMLDGLLYEYKYKCLSCEDNDRECDNERCPNMKKIKHIIEKATGMCIEEVIE